MGGRSAAAVDREEPDAPAVPPASGREGAPLAGCLIVSLVTLLPALLYFGLFFAILLDEIILQTNWFVDDLPEPAIEVLRVIYAPLIWLLTQHYG